MAGTKEGAQLAKATILKRDPGFYSRIGRTGGQNGVGSEKGFATMDKELHRIASSKGGSKSRRLPTIDHSPLSSDDIRTLEAKS